MVGVDGSELDVGWVIRNSCPSAEHQDKSESEAEKPVSTLKDECEGEKLRKTGTPSPMSSTVKIDELDAKNPGVTTHVQVIGPNRLVKQRRNSAVDPAATDLAGAASVLHPFDHGLKGRETSQLHDKTLDVPLRRTQSASLPEASQKRKSGFFRSLFRRKGSSSGASQASTAAPAAAHAVPAAAAAAVVPPVSPQASRSRRHSVSAGNVDGLNDSSIHTNYNRDTGTRAEADADVPRYLGNGKTRSSSSENDDARGVPLMRVKTESQASSEDMDPKLEEFIQYYKEHGLNNKANLDASKKPQRIAKASFSLDGAMSNSTHSVDKKGRPIPPHPPRSRLPPALKVKPESTPPPSSQNALHRTATSSSKFGSFLKRVTSHTDESYASSPRLSNTSSFASLPKDIDESSIESSESGINTSVIPGLENLKPLKRVSFAANTYFNDPPQQICSRNPRKGEVEVKSDGSVVIHRLTPEEKRQILENTSCGIVVGGTGQLKLINQDKVADVSADGKTVKEDDAATQRRNIELAAAEAAAEARAKDAPLDLQRTVTNNEEEVGVNFSAEKVKIDKPMISRRDKSSTTSLASMMSSESTFVPSEDESDILPPRNIKIPHDVVYTRCCHLREILPIPATMKQLKKGSTEPIPLLQLRNPKPSKVEVLSFSDFLSIAPVLCLSLDGVSLSVEMLRIILSAITYKENFEKLSLRNTPLSEEGWKVLSFFVSKCKSLHSLDVTMVPGLPLNVQKPSKSSNNSTVERMVCNMDNRSDMNWNLLSAAVATKGGLEEMIVSGACMKLSQFQNFIDIAWTKTVRLGLAYNKLTAEQCEILATWIANSMVTGVDIGYNDLSGKINPFLKTIMSKVKTGKNVFKFLSLNSTNLTIPKGATAENNEVVNLLNALCYCENLKFLDLSNNPGLFPYGLLTITTVLPVFVSLVRFHLDNNKLSTTSVMQLAEVLPMCEKLNYFSLLGTHLDLISASALAAAVKKSNSIITMDIDYHHVPDKIKEKISLYTMKNTQKELQRIGSGGDKEHHEKLNSLQEELALLLTEDISNRHDYDHLVSNFFHRIQSLRSKLNAATEELFKLRVNGELSTEGKETLIRFCFIDASFEKGLALLAKRSHRGKKSNPEDSSSPNEYPSKNSGQNSTSILSPSRFSDSGHAALLPFHQPSVESYDPADEEVHITESRDEVQNEANQQLKEEGSVLRRAVGIIDELRSSADVRGKELNTDLLKEISEKYDGNDIKNLLLKDNITNILTVLDDLTDKGVSLDDLFKKKHEDKKSRSASPQPSSPKNSRTVVGVEANLLENKKDDYSDSDYTSDEEDEEQIDRAYDEVLDTLERSRTATMDNI